MEQLAKRIASSISGKLNYDDDRRAVIAYGLIAIFQMSTIGLLVSVIGLWAGFWYEAAVIFFGVGLLRKSTGGAHAQTLLGCTIISVCSICLMAAFCRYIMMYLPVYQLIAVYMILYGVCFAVAYQKVPVDTPNKPITRPEKIKRLRRQSFFKLGACFVLTFGLVLSSPVNLRLAGIAASVCCAILWQILTLTKWGALAITAMDSFFCRCHS